MAVILETEMYSFDTSAISKGDFIRAQYHTWKKFQNGLIARVTSRELKVFYIPAIGNVTNFFIIPAAAVAAGLWNIETSPDFATIETTETETDDDTETETGEEENEDGTETDTDTGETTEGE